MRLLCGECVNKPMISYQLTSIAIAIVVAAMILYLVRRNRLQGQHSLWWIGVVLIVVLLAAMPNVVDRAAILLGVSYPPTLVLVMGFAALLIKLVAMDLERSQQELRIRRLIQRLALLEEKVKSNESSGR